MNLCYHKTPGGAPIDSWRKKGAHLWVLTHGQLGNNASPNLEGRIFFWLPPCWVFHTTPPCGYIMAPTISCLKIPGYCRPLENTGTRSKSSLCKHLSAEVRGPHEEKWKGYGNRCIAVIPGSPSPYRVNVNIPMDKTARAWASPGTRLSADSQSGFLVGDGRMPKSYTIPANLGGDAYPDGPSAHDDPNHPKTSARSDTLVSLRLLASSGWTKKMKTALFLNTPIWCMWGIS
jgi:hypothetical protein